MGQVNRNGNTISVEGEFGNPNLHYLLSNMHTAVEKAGYEEVLLDFSKCTASFPSAMLALCAQAMSKRNAGVETSLVLPEKSELSRLFHNTNWAHLIDPTMYDASTFRGYTQVPATQYQNPDEQQLAVNRIVNAILGAIPEIERADFAAFEWSINELTDNVLTHAVSDIGGLIQVSTFKRSEKIVQFIIADAGRSIPKTLRETHPELKSDTEALDKAIREGVTRDKAVGQGNGLFGSYQICSHCNGRFQVESAYAKLIFSERNGLHVKEEKIPYDGTLIVASINFSKPHLLEEALKFGGEQYTPVDFVDTNYLASDDKINFVMKEESQSFGSRLAGTPVRSKLQNLYNMGNRDKIYIDFDNIPLISSSFADEVFGKMFVAIGAIGFMQTFEFRNIAVTVRKLIDKAIAQRMAVS